MAKKRTLDLKFYRDLLADLVRELRFEMKALVMLSCFMVLVGISLVATATLFHDNLKTIFFSVGAMLVTSVTVFPLATVLSIKRKLIIIEHHEEALQTPSPTDDAIAEARLIVEKES